MGPAPQIGPGPNRCHIQLARWRIYAHSHAMAWTAAVLKAELQAIGIPTSKLTYAQALLKCAAYRRINKEQFDEARQQARGKNAGLIRELAFPDAQEVDLLPDKPKRSRPDVAARLKDKVNWEHDTVTMTWSRLCKRGAQVLPVEVALANVNRVAFEAYELASFHVHRVLEEGGKLEQPLDQSFFNRCCNAVCCTEPGNRKPVVGDAALDASAALYDAERTAAGVTDVVAAVNLRPMFQLLSQQMATMTGNNMKLNFRRRLYKHIKAVADCTSKLAHKLYQQVANPALVADDDLVLRMRAMVFQDLEAAAPLRDKVVVNQSHLLMRPLHTIQRAGTLKTFNLLPHKGGFTTSFVTINNNTLRALLVMAGVPVPSEEEFLKEADDWWRKLFHINQLEPKNGRRRFGHQVATDGRSVKVLMLKPAKRVWVRLDVGEEGHVSLHLLCRPPSPEPTDVLHGLKVIRSVDPGYRAPYTAATILRNPDTGEEQLQREVLQCTVGEYYNDIKARKSERLLQGWTAANAALRAASKDMPARVVTSTRECMGRSIYVLQNWTLLTSFYGARRMRNLKLLRHIYTKKKLTDMCQKLTAGGNRHEVAIGFGDFSRAYGSCIKGQCGPIAKLKRELRQTCYVFDVDEDYTSKTCSCCHARSLVKMRSEKRTRRGRQTTQIHGVLHCQTSACKGKTWDRDVNASHNIMQLFLCMLHGRDRPDVFRRS